METFRIDIIRTSWLERSGNPDLSRNQTVIKPRRTRRAQRIEFSRRQRSTFVSFVRFVVKNILPQNEKNKIKGLSGFDREVMLFH